MAHIKQMDDRLKAWEAQSDNYSSRMVVAEMQAQARYKWLVGCEVRDPRVRRQIVGEDGCAGGDKHL